MDKRVFFDSDTYDTPVNDNPSLLERIRKDNRLYFSLKFAQVTFSSMFKAKRGVYDDVAWEQSSYFVFNFIERSGGVFHIEGMDNITKVKEPVIFIANHMSTLETFILPCLISPRRRVTFAVKDGLVKHPLFKDVMLSRDPIVVGRVDPRKDLEEVMTKGSELLSKGTSVIIFPQSTRSQTLDPAHFNTIGVKLAKKAGVQVVPVALKTDFWQNGKLIKELGPIDSKIPIYFKFGEPITVEGNGKETNHAIFNFIKENVDRWSAPLATTK